MLFIPSYSYSASRNTSGIIHDSTSFVGCENKKVSFSLYICHVNDPFIGNL